jgi:hypothetical protein
VANSISDEIFPNDNILLKSKNCHYIESTGVLDFKKRVREYLENNYDFLKHSDHNTVNVLFLGRFEKIKGIEFLNGIAKLASKLKFNIFLMGYFIPGQSEPKEIISKLSKLKNVFLIDDSKKQKEVGVFIRALADFIIVPSTVEGYGLVAAEGQLYGSIPVVSNIGGLQDIVLDYHQHPTNWTGFFFDINPTSILQTDNNLSKVFKKALKFYKSLKPNKKEKILKRIMDRNKRWTAPGGSIDQYTDVYIVGKEMRRNNIVVDLNLKDRNYYSNNHIKSPSFEENNSEYWIKYYEGYEISKDIFRSGLRSIKMTSFDDNSQMGCTQDIFLNQQIQRNVLVSGWSKAIDVSGKVDGIYSILFRFIFDLFGYQF